MKPMRISLIAALIASVLVAYSPAASAEEVKDGNAAPKGEGRPGGPGGARGEAAKERLNKLAEELKLTDVQKTKVEAAMKEQQEKMRASRDPNATPEERKEKMKAGREEMSKKMKAILTAEQFAKWEKMPQGRGPGGPGRPGGPGGEKKDGGPKVEKN
jgi:Spy/CpxP family protein refolding chaperone